MFSFFRLEKNNWFSFLKIIVQTFNTPFSFRCVAHLCVQKLFQQVDLTLNPSPKGREINKFIYFIYPTIFEHFVFIKQSFVSSPPPGDLGGFILLYFFLHFSRMAHALT